MTFLFLQIYKLTALCAEEAGFLLQQLVRSSEEAELSKAWSISRFAICFYILRLGLFDFEVAELMIDRVQWND